MPDNLNFFNDLLPFDSNEENESQEQGLFFDLIDDDETTVSQDTVELESDDTSLESPKDGKDVVKNLINLKTLPLLQKIN